MSYSEDLTWIIDFLMREGANYAEARMQKTADFGITLKNGIPEPPEYAEGSGFGIRVLAGDAMAFSSTNTMTKKALEEAGLKALKSAKAMSKAASKVSLSKEEVHKGSWEVDYRVNPTDVDTEEVLQILRDIDSAVLGVKGADFPKRLLIFGGGIEDKIFVNSEGARISSRIPRIGGYFILTAYEGGKGTLQRSIQLSEAGGWERIKSMDPANQAKEEAEAMSKILTQGVAVQPGKYDIVVGGEVAGIISHEACGHPQEADRILGREAAQAGESYLDAKSLGRKIGSPAVNVSDDPTIPNSNGFYIYDDEGVKAVKKVLIRRGIITGFLHNRETASELGVHSNAAARATSYAREPIIRMSNTYMEPGGYTLDELLEGVNDGLYIKSFQEWNIDDIRWNNRYVGLEAYAVKGGEIREPVRAPIIEATTEVIFSSVKAAGKDIIFKAATCGKGQPEQGAPVWTGGPSLLMLGLHVKGR